jgi:hypothetical protein
MHLMYALHLSEGFVVSGAKALLSTKDTHQQIQPTLFAPSLFHKASMNRSGHVGYTIGEIFIR